MDALIQTAFDAGAVDLVVSAYRGYPDLLGALLSSEVARERTLHMLARAGDESLTRAVGLETASLADPVESLSRREKEVYSLLCEGLSNGDIATRLFITEGTVKVHVQHVFDKLGVRSREPASDARWFGLTGADRSIAQAAPTSFRTEEASETSVSRAPFTTSASSA